MQSAVCGIEPGSAQPPSTHDPKRRLNSQPSAGNGTVEQEDISRSKEEQLPLHKKESSLGSNWEVTDCFHAACTSFNASQCLANKGGQKISPAGMTAPGRS